MRTADQCLAKASEMAQRAAKCPTSAEREDYLKLADDWRDLAIEAARQDGPATH